MVRGMGTDIHMFVEVREGEGAHWRPSTAPIPCGWPPGEHQPGCYGCGGSGFEKVWRDRNYDAFAILAGVRNGRGFAGCITGDPFEPLSEPRGLPDDLSPELRALFEGEYSDEAYDRNKRLYGCGSGGDHSFSWLTLRELAATEEYWSREHRYRGVVSLGEVARMREAGEAGPRSWSGGVLGGLVRHVPLAAAEVLAACVEWGPVPESSWEERKPRRIRLTQQAYALWEAVGHPRDELRIFEELWNTLALLSDEEVARLRQPETKQPVDIYTEVEWCESYRDCAGRLYSEFVPALARLGHPDHVRIVFGFDS